MQKRYKNSLMKKKLTDNVWRVLGLESSCDDTAASVLTVSYTHLTLPTILRV